MGLYWRAIRNPPKPAQLAIHQLFNPFGAEADQFIAAQAFNQAFCDLMALLVQALCGQLFGQAPGGVILVLFLPAFERYTPMVFPCAPACFGDRELLSVCQRKAALLEAQLLPLGGLILFITQAAHANECRRNLDQFRDPGAGRSIPHLFALENPVFLERQHCATGPRDRLIAGRRFGSKPALVRQHFNAHLSYTGDSV